MSTTKPQTKQVNSASAPARVELYFLERHRANKKRREREQRAWIDQGNQQLWRARPPLANPTETNDKRLKIKTAAKPKTAE